LLEWVAAHVEPRRNLGGIESDEPSYHDVGDASFGDESADVADAGGEPLCELFDGQELGVAVGGHGTCFRWTEVTGSMGLSLAG